MGSMGDQIAVWVSADWWESAGSAAVSIALALPFILLHILPSLALTVGVLTGGMMMVIPVRCRRTCHQLLCQ